MTQGGSPHIGFSRKYRPKVFSEIVGQEAVSATLRNAVIEKKIAPAYLFFGSRGVGKTTTARVLAKALNCRRGPTPDPCGECPACLEIAQGSCIDVLELDAATHTQVERVREMILETVSLAPSRDRFKVFIIDEVHMLSTASFNALLKTLEEPPAHVVFILATTDPGKIPGTVVSRCQRFRFRPLPLAVLTSHLRRMAEAEGIRVEGAALELLARTAAGSLRDAVSLLEQAHAYADGGVGEAQVRELLGCLPEEHLLAVAEALLGRDPRKLHRALSSLREDGFDGGQLLRDLRERLHEAYLYRMGVAEDLDERWLERAGPHSPETFSFLIQRLNRALESIRQSESPQLALELGLYGMLEAVYDPREWIARLESLERRLGAAKTSEADSGAVAVAGRSATPSSPAPAAGSEVAVSSGQDAQEVWRTVVEHFRSDKPGLAQVLGSGRFSAGEGAGCRLALGRIFDADLAEKNKRLVEAKLATTLGRDVQLSVELDSQAYPSGISDPGEIRRDTQDGSASVDDPAVRKVLEFFPGKVRRVKGDG